MNSAGGFKASSSGFSLSKVKSLEIVKALQETL